MNNPAYGTDIDDDDEEMQGWAQVHYGEHQYGTPVHECPLCADVIVVEEEFAAALALAAAAAIELRAVVSRVAPGRGRTTPSTLDALRTLKDVIAREEAPAPVPAWFWVVEPNEADEEAGYGEWRCPNGHGELQAQEYHVESWKQNDGESTPTLFAWQGSGECIYEASKEDCIYCPTCNLEMGRPPIDGIEETYG